MLSVLNLKQKSFKEEHLVLRERPWVFQERPNILLVPYDPKAYTCADLDNGVPCNNTPLPNSLYCKKHLVPVY